jgi:hypothetical protein
MIVAGGTLVNTLACEEGSMPEQGTICVLLLAAKQTH